VGSVPKKIQKIYPPPALETTQGICYNVRSKMKGIPETSTTLLRDIASDVKNARWGEFVARYRPMCQRYLQRHFPALDHDDILQETFAAVAHAMPSYRYAPNEKGHFRNYLVGVVRNKALMALRSRERDEKLKSAYAESAPAERNGDCADDEMWRKSVFEIALQQLMADASINERTKQIFVRTAIRKEPPEEVARSLGVSRNVVDQQKRRMLARFKAFVAALKDVV